MKKNDAKKLALSKKTVRSLSVNTSLRTGNVLNPTQLCGSIACTQACTQLGCHPKTPGCPM